MDQKQIEQACVAFVAPRLQSDEQAKALLVSVAMDEPNAEPNFRCFIEVSKKRVRKAKAAP